MTWPKTGAAHTLFIAFEDKWVKLKVNGVSTHCSYI